MPPSSSIAFSQALGRVRPEPQRTCLLEPALETSLGVGSSFYQNPRTLNSPHYPGPLSPQPALTCMGRHALFVGPIKYMLREKVTFLKLRMVFQPKRKVVLGFSVLRLGERGESEVTFSAGRPCAILVPHSGGKLQSTAEQP